VEPLTGKAKIVERVKLLAYEDAVLGRPVIIDLVFTEEARDLDDLALKLNLGDLIDAVRTAHGKLPRERGLIQAEVEQESGQATPQAEGLSFDLPRNLLNKRFIFPLAFETTVQTDLFVKGGFGMLRVLLTGRGEGGPFQRLGLLGRGAVEERAGTSDAPFYYATLLQVIRFLAEHTYRNQVTPAKIREAFDALRSELANWTRQSCAGARHADLAARILANPLAPYALRRTVPPPSVADMTDQHLELPNRYGITPDLLHALDEHFDGFIGPLTDNETLFSGLTQRVMEVVDAWRGEAAFLKAQARIRRILSRWTAGIMAASIGAMVLPWLLSPADLAAIAEKLYQPELVERLLVGAAVGAAADLLLAIGGTAFLLWRRRTELVHRGFRRLLKGLAKNPALPAALARAQAFSQLCAEVARTMPDRASSTLTEMESSISFHAKSSKLARKLIDRAREAKRPARKEWLRDLSFVLHSYLKLKADCMDYHKLTRVELPPLDPPDLYTPEELQDKWKQNACVCYDDGFPTLIIGMANSAAVYFMDVVGSTEISTKQTLSNALELYSRAIRRVNESGVEPLWRKEMGDGRIYCHSTHEALKRSVMSVQGAAHPKIGLGIGIGLSVGEIYTDVTTGDFLNETTNRAARLSGRDELAGAFINARYVRQSAMVHVKYGKLYNAGIALDDTALRALGVSGWHATALVPPWYCRFPLVVDYKGESAAGAISFTVERMDPGVLTRRLKGAGQSTEFARYRVPTDRMLAFEVFCDKSMPGIKYPTPLEGRHVREHLHAHGIESPAFMGGEMESEIEIARVPIALSSGAQINLAIKPEKAYLKGIGAVTIGEVEVPGMILDDPDIKLAEFLASL
jgi:hypothetical protein